MEQDFAKALEAFVAKQQAAADKQHKPMWGNKRYTRLHTENGRRYVKIVARNGVQDDLAHLGNQAWGFVDKTNGDVLKAATWKTPAKNFPRGNIYENDKEFSWTGVQ